MTIVPIDSGGTTFAVGAGSATAKLKIWPENITLFELFVPPNDRRKGLASQIVEEAKDFAAERKLPLGLWPGPFGEESTTLDVLHRFYAAHGFVPVFWAVNWPKESYIKDF